MALLVIFVLLATAAGSQATAPPSAPNTTHIKLLWHEVVSGRHPMAIQAASVPTTNASKSFFGAVYVTDDLLTDALLQIGTSVGLKNASLTSEAAASN
ncbi:dirigent protein 21 [Brachypodium distachyon]|uniref:dirigent protein 21 n=1 Tax=Brachypodium distachyon TaxID=15368 RepID=UPI00052FE294|nr:dirigent protein 21 [Brachypodium distachyon]|eukprot:XP_010239483.1 dirigent protein 21 [Brachypodium distachyon]